MKKNYNEENITNEGRIWENAEEDTGINLGAILLKEVPEIYDEISKNLTFNPMLSKNFSLIKEILLNGITVGISTYKLGTCNDMPLATLNFIYVLEEFRGNNLLVKDIENTQKLGHIVNIELPSQYVIDSLIKNDLAIDIGNNLVISKIPLSFVIDTLFDSNTDISAMSLFYDKYLSKIVLFYNDEIYLSPFLDVDIFDFNASEHFSKVNRKYFDKAKKHFENSAKKIINQSFPH